MAAKKTTKKADPMLGALAASFGAAKAAPAAPREETKAEPEVQQGRGAPPASPAPADALEAPPPAPTTPAVPPAPNRSAVPPAPPEGFAGGGVKKTTVSFHESEQDKIDLILDALKRSRRHRGGFSDAIKIALRLCILDDESIGRAWDEARAQDQRVLRHRRNS
jgi:hypothetical protein